MFQWSIFSTNENKNETSALYRLIEDWSKEISPFSVCRPDASFVFSSFSLLFSLLFSGVVICRRRRRRRSSLLLFSLFFSLFSFVRTQINIASCDHSLCSFVKSRKEKKKNHYNDDDVVGVAHSTKVF